MITPEWEKRMLFEAYYNDSRPGHTKMSTLDQLMACRANHGFIKCLGGVMKEQFLHGTNDEQFDPRGQGRCDVMNAWIQELFEKKGHEYLNHPFDSSLKKRMK